MAPRRLLQLVVALGATALLAATVVALVAAGIVAVLVAGRIARPGIAYDALADTVSWAGTMALLDGVVRG